MALFSVELGNDRTFHATDRIRGESPIFGNLPNTPEGQQQLVNWVMERFIEAVRGKVSEFERLRKNEWYYNGFHWNDPEANRNNEVRNFCFATVETVHPILTEIRPRPEVVLRKQYGRPDAPFKADDLNERAEWLMDVSGWDYNCCINDREKLKHGYSVYLLNVDEGGVCKNIPYSVYDFYRDPSATNDDEMDYYFLARPLSTDFLAELYGDPGKYPHLWESDAEGRPVEFKLKPDNILSPSYKAIQYPFDRAAESGSSGASFEPENIFGAVARLESGDPNPPSNATVSLVKMGDMEKRAFGRTTFHIDMIVRDRTVVQAHYAGQITEPSAEDAQALPDGSSEPTFRSTPAPGAYRRYEKVCESGWRIITIAADGTFVKSAPLDPCYLGRNVVIDRDYPQVGRWECPGELDNVIPVNRSLNRRLTNLRNAHAFETDPVLLLDTGAGTDISGRSISSGDVIRKRPGTEVRFLDPPKPTAAQFELVGLDIQHMDFISGVHDVTTGRRPEGIEAASAIRNLQEAAQTRIRGKEVPSFEAKKLMLKKMMNATGRKLDPGTMFMAQNGNMKPVAPQVFVYEYEIRFAPGSGTAIGRAQQEEKYLGLFQAGLVDPQTALEHMNVKGVPQILGRQQLMLESQAKAAGQRGGSQDAPPKEK